MEIKRGIKHLQKSGKRFIGIKLLFPVKVVIGRSNRMVTGLVRVTKVTTRLLHPMCTYYDHFMRTNEKKLSVRCGGGIWTLGSCLNLQDSISTIHLIFTCIKAFMTRFLSIFQPNFRAQTRPEKRREEAAMDGEKKLQKSKVKLSYDEIFHIFLLLGTSSSLLSV